MKNKQNQSDNSEIAQRYGKVMERLRKPLGQFVKNEVPRPWNGAVWITEADLAKAKVTGSVDEVTPRFVPLAGVMKRKYGNPAPVEFFCELIKEFGPTAAFVVMITGRGQKIAEVFLVEHPLPRTAKPKVKGATGQSRQRN